MLYQYFGRLRSDNFPNKKKVLILSQAILCTYFTSQYSNKTAVITALKFEEWNCTSLRAIKSMIIAKLVQQNMA